MNCSIIIKAPDIIEESPDTTKQSEWKMFPPVVIIAYDDYSALENVNYFSSSHIFDRIHSALVYCKKTSPIDSVVIYSDYLTKVIFTAYLADLDKNTSFPESFYSLGNDMYMREHRELFSSLNGKVTFFSFSSCSEENYKKRVMSILACASPEGLLHNDTFPPKFFGTRRLYDTYVS